MSDPYRASSPNELVGLLTRAVESLQRGDPRGAEAAARRALKLAPGNPDCHLIAATALHNLGRLDEAKTHYAESLRLKPGNPRVLTNLGLLQLNAGEGAEAVRSLQQAVELAPDALEARHYLARALGLARRFHDAVDEFALVHEKVPNDLAVITGYARALRSVERVADALAVLLRGEELHGDDADIQLELAGCHAALGDFDEAEAAARRAIRLQPDKTTAYKQLSNYRRLTGADVEALEALLGREAELAEGERADLHYALGMVHDQNGRHTEAFQAIATANAIKDRAGTYDREATAEYFEHLANASVRDPAQPWPEGDPSDKPIFIVGMPRSGTTLVEQILAGHPEVLAGGEQSTMPDGVVRLMSSDARYTPEVEALNAGQLAELARYYLDHLPDGADTAKRVTDKLPANVRYLPLIARLFPNARFILCHRHPMDITWSIFKHGFADNIAFSTSLANIAHTLTMVWDFMDHWLQQSPENALEVCYEQLVRDFEPGARRIVAFAGLEWDAACLEPHKVDRTVRTASLWQVRQPVFSSSIGAWRNYAQELAETEATLAETIAAYEARFGPPAPA